MNDDVPTGTIIIHKTGEKLVSIEQSTNDIIFNYENVELSGVSFDVFALEDIVRPDGSGEILIRKDELVGTITTNDEGEAVIDFLPVGKYYAVEKNTVPGFVLDETPVEFNISYVDGYTKVIYVDKTVKNERQQVEVTVMKKDSETEEVLSDAEFGLFTATDIYSVNGELILKAGSLIEMAKSDDDGVAVFKADLPLGTYFVKELKAPAGFVKSDEVFEIDAMDIADDVEVFRAASVFKNDRIKVDFTKTDITGNHEIEGAKLSVIDKDGKIIDSWTSGKGTHRIEKLAAGIYTLCEESAPYGYRIAEEVEFTILETNEIQKVTMKDGTPMGKIIINKTDSITGKPIAGVEFEIRNEAGEVMEILVTDENGYAESKEIAAFEYNDGKCTGSFKYTVVETKAATGYKLDTTEYKVVFDYEGDAPELITYTLDITNELDEPDVPKTGDNTPIHLYVALLGLSLAGAVALAFGRKKRIW